MKDPRLREISYQPIGVFRGPQVDPIEAPRQGVLLENNGEIQLFPQIDENCLRDLDGFDFIWLLYDFHHNSSWSPTVRPPRDSSKRRGVFATRSPYRPNSIGLSCVKLLQIENRRLIISGHDLLDQTPILDIKPYLVYADSFPHARQGWLDPLNQYRVVFRPQVEQKIAWLSDQLNKDLKSLLTQQLSFEPTHSKIKRVKAKSDGFEFAYKTWRFGFQLHFDTVEIISVSSGYSLTEIDNEGDPYNDKKVHLLFSKLF